MVLLIGGHVRSGTTLLRNLCNSHPEMAITDEFNNISELGKTFRKHSYRMFRKMWKKSIGNRQRRLIWHWSNFTFVVRYMFEMYKYQNGVVDLAAIDMTLRSIFPEARIVGDKTPWYIFPLNNFVAIEGLSCLVIYRDCRDVTSSTLKKVRTQWSKKPMQHVDTAEKIAKRWVRCIEIMERHKDKIHTIRYEDLVKEPRQELEVLSEWIGVDSSGFSDCIIRSIRSNSIGRYKTELTKEELKTVMEIAGPTIARLGYC